jgi:hypothetical protein
VVAGHYRDEIVEEKDKKNNTNFGLNPKRWKYETSSLVSVLATGAGLR